MNKRGIFGPVRLIVIGIILIFIWLVLLPNSVTPGITTSISSVQGSANGEMTEFLLRMIPWMFVFILVVGFIWMASTS